MQTYLFYDFRDPADLRPEHAVRPFSISWQNAAQAFPLGLEITFDKLPSRCEIFDILTDMPQPVSQ